MKNSPIIFCHYGNSKYLEYVFKCAKISNPNKEIILLGDKSNIDVAAKCKITHFLFSDYDFGEDLKTFDQVYQLITTEGFDSHKHGEDWNKFVFRKWFVLNNFLIKHSIEQFWHFDSDNMIFTDLATLESKYADIDCGEQCDGNCMKGLFNNQKIIERYIKKINEVFMRTKFIESVKEKMKNSQGGSFNEMSVYEIFREEENFKSTRFSAVVDNSSFDDLICRGYGFKMEKLPFGEDVKLVFLNPDGRFFCQEENGNPVEMHALNLSWIPIYIFAGILQHFKKNHHKPKVAFDPNSKTLSQIPVPFKQQFKKYRKILKQKIATILCQTKLNP